MLSDETSNFMHRSPVKKQKERKKSKHRIIWRKARVWAMQPPAPVLAFAGLQTPSVRG
jgi:hypothetical protein